MKFYDYWRSSAAFRVRIALNLKGLSPEREFIHLRRKDQQTPEYRRLNPQGLVPTIVDDDGTVVIQSLAIVEYLDETRPDGPRFLPEDAPGRARVRALALAVACEIHPLNNLRVLRHLGKEFGISEDDRTDRWYRHWVAEGLEALEGMLAGHPATGTFCHGDAPGLADICLVPQVGNARRFDCDLSAFPTICAIEAACLELDAFSAAQPERQPDAE